MENQEPTPELAGDDSAFVEPELAKKKKGGRRRRKQSKPKKVVAEREEAEEPEDTGILMYDACVDAIARDLVARGKENFVMSAPKEERDGSPYRR